MGAAALAFAAAGAAQTFTDAKRQFGLPTPGLGRPPRFAARAIVSHRTVAPGDSLHLAVEMSVAAEMWLYGPAPGGKVVKPLPLTARIAAGGLRVGGVLFSPTSPHRTDFPDGTSDVHQVYETEAHLFVPVTVPSDAVPGRYELALKLSGQVCEADGTCVPVGQDLVSVVEVGAQSAASPEWTGRLGQILSQSRTAEQWGAAPAPTEPIQFAQPPGLGLTVAAGLGLALLAGLILNIMPCVLPVIPLRLLALLEQAKQARRRFFTLGMAFAAGVFLFFVALAGANVALKLVLQYTLKWGEPFRHPEFVIPMVLFLVALAANMFGAFTVTVPGRIASAEGGQGHLGAAGMGFLMAVLSTPCSFAILAAAFGWAQAQELWLGTVGILFIGVGMALPHAVLAAFPRIVSRIPRAGRWTELFKQFAGFVLLGIAVWLIGTQMQDRYLAWVMGYGVVLAMCLWVWGGWVRYDAPARRRWAVRGAALLVAAASGWWMLSPPKPLAVAMRPFDAAEIARARSQGKTVLVKFTAGWCAECILIDQLIYDSPEVAEGLAARGVVAFKGDVTKRDMPANEMLEKQLRQPGPPVTAILPPADAPPLLLIGSFSKADLFQALDKAGAGP